MVQLVTAEGADLTALGGHDLPLAFTPADLGGLTLADMSALGEGLAGVSDVIKFLKGDLIVEFYRRPGVVGPRDGRPSKERVGYTLESFSERWGAAQQSVSQWYHMASFYPPDTRTRLFALDGFSWSKANIARTHVQAREGDVEDAIDLLNMHGDLTVGELRRALKDEPLVDDPPDDDLIRPRPVSRQQVAGWLRVLNTRKLMGGDVAPEIDDLIQYLEETL